MVQHKNNINYWKKALIFFNYIPLTAGRLGRKTGEGKKDQPEQDGG